jgi:hypothetical protein
MNQAVPSPTVRSQTGVAELPARNEAHSSGVSWAAVLAGAFVGAALSLALLAIGTGIGLSSVLPWANADTSARAIGRTAILWMILMQVIASSIGGYLAGRLRTKWVNVHTHEVYFRDTAHGFLVWAVGLVITAAFLTSAATAVMGGAARASALGTEPSAAAESSDTFRSDAYWVDTLLRSNASRVGSDTAAVRREIALIMLNGLREGSLPISDRAYLAQVVAARSGASQPDAEKRVDEAFSETQQATEAARKALAHAMYWTFLALLVGAFCASFAATIGGRQRDRMIAI